MAKNGLILYASRGGNTEKVAMRFKQTFEKYGWGCDTLNLTRYSDLKKLPFTPKDEYDLVCIGSLVVDGIPVNEIFHGRGILLARPGGQQRGFAPITEPYGMKKGIVFVTYSDGRRGTTEALPALDCLELRLEDARIKCIGRFACPGSHSSLRLWRWAAPNVIAEKMKVSLDQANVLLYRYKDNPKSPEFDSLTPEQREVFDKESNSKPEATTHRESGGVRDFKWDINNRPSERDLLKAEIFLSEILEDFYGGDVEAAPLCQYVCIA